MILAGFHNHFDKVKIIIAIFLSSTEYNIPCVRCLIDSIPHFISPVVYHVFPEFISISINFCKENIIIFGEWEGY